MSESPKSDTVILGNPYPADHSLLKTYHDIGNVVNYDDLPWSLIVTPPRKHLDFVNPPGLKPAKRYLKSLQHLSADDPRDRKKLAHLLASLPNVTKVTTNSFELTPAFSEQTLLEAVSGLCSYCCRAYRASIDPSSASVNNPVQPLVLNPGHQIACAHRITRRGKSTIVSILPARSQSKQQPKYQRTDRLKEHLHAECLTSCIELVQNFFDDVRAAIQEQLNHRPATRPDPVCHSLPRLESLSSNQLVFSNLGANHAIVFQSGIMSVLNHIKNIYTDGDPGGRKIYREKRRSGFPVANTDFRIQIIYTAIMNSDGNLVVKFLFDKGTKPYFIQPNSHGRHRPMNDREILSMRTAFAMHCAEALTRYFQEIMEEAHANNVEPDYWQTWAKESNPRPPDYAINLSANLPLAAAGLS